MKSSDKDKVLQKPFVVYQLMFPNMKRYIGWAKGSAERRFWKGHVYWAEHEGTLSVHFAIRKFGVHNVKVETLFRYDSAWKAKRTEAALIRLYRCNNQRFGYNMTAGGEGLSNPSTAVRLKMSKAARSRSKALIQRTLKKSLESRRNRTTEEKASTAAKMSARIKAWHASLTPEQRKARGRKISRTRKERHISPSIETRLKISRTLKGRPKQPQPTSVVQFSSN